jgi:hypothetical protein
MFGLFKKRITPEELGYSVMRLAIDHLVTHADQSIAWCFEGFDASGQNEKTIGKYWEQFLVKNGVSVEVQRHYTVWFAHAVIQTAVQRYDYSIRKRITQGAMSAMKTGPDYDFEYVFSQIEEINQGKGKFSKKIGALISDTPGTDVARYLLAECLVPGVKKNSAFFDNFGILASTFFGSMGTVNRAIDFMLGKFKL